MIGRRVTGELGMRLQEEDLKARGRQQCRKAGTGLQREGKVVRKRPVTEETTERQMRQKVH